MTNESICFKTIPHGSPDWKKAVSLRENILRKPLGAVFSPEELEEEKDHIQIAGFINNELIATAVLVPELTVLKMQRVVVSDDLRNQHIGSRMMEFCEEYARNEGYQSLYCHARNTAVNFYLNNGYTIEGEYFDEDRIPHVKMWKKF